MSDSTILEDVDDLILEANEKTTGMFKRSVMKLMAGTFGIGASLGAIIFVPSMSLAALLFVLAMGFGFLTGSALKKLGKTSIVRSISDKFSDEIMEINDIISSKEYIDEMKKIVGNILSNNKCFQSNSTQNSNDHKDCFDSFTKDLISGIKRSSVIDEDTKKDLINKLNDIVKKVERQKLERA